MAKRQIGLGGDARLARTLVLDELFDLALYRALRDVDASKVSGVNSCIARESSTGLAGIARGRRQRGAAVHDEDVPRDVAGRR